MVSQRWEAISSERIEGGFAGEQMADFSDAQVNFHLPFCQCKNKTIFIFLHTK